MRILVIIGAPRREAEKFNFYASRAIGQRTREFHAARSSLGPTQKRRDDNRPQAQGRDAPPDRARTRFARGRSCQSAERRIEVRPSSNANRSAQSPKWLLALIGASRGARMVRLFSDRSCSSCQRAIIATLIPNARPPLRTSTNSPSSILGPTNSKPPLDMIRFSETLYQGPR